MDVKSAFLNGFIEEEVFVEQPCGFESEKKPDHVFKLSKALYGPKILELGMQDSVNSLSPMDFQLEK